MNSIDAAFVRQFEADVHLAYQRMGAKMLGTWRRKLNVRGMSTTFQKIGAGIAGKKGRNSQVPIMNLNHDPIECTLEDWYAGEFVDKLDELKIEHDERQSVARSIAAALGRRSDQLGIDQLDTGTKATAAAGAITKPKVQEAYADLGDNDVPDDGERYFVVSPKGWVNLMDLDEFSRVNYVPVEELPFQGSGMTAKRWFSFFTFQHSGLTIDGADIRNNATYHKTAIGHASGSEVYLDITWQGKEQAHLLVGGMSQGACKIDDRGIYLVLATET